MQIFGGFKRRMPIRTCYIEYVIVCFSQTDPSVFLYLSLSTPTPYHPASRQGASRRSDDIPSILHNFREACVGHMWQVIVLY